MLHVDILILIAWRSKREQFIYKGGNHIIIETAMWLQSTVSRDISNGSNGIPHLWFMDSETADVHNNCAPPSGSQFRVSAKFFI